MRIRRFLSLLSVGILTGLVGLSAAPRAALSDAEVFRVSSVPVDVTAVTAAQARNTAITQGHRQAFDTLMARLVLEVDLINLPPLSNEEIVELVQDFSVANERTSAVRYLADFTFRFKPEAVRDLFRAYRLRFTETRSKPLLLLPVFGLRGAAMLWQEDNLWAFAWGERDMREELVPLMVPLGDLGDVAAINAERALSGDPDALTAIAQRYGTEEAMVVQAVLSGDPLVGDARLDVAVDRYGVTIWRMYEGAFEQSEPGEPELLFAAAIDQIVAVMQDAWKEENHLSFDEQRMLSAIVPLTSLNDWLEVKRRLQGVAPIVSLELVYLTRQFVQVDLAFIGDEIRLARALKQSDLYLSPSALSGWELHLGSAAAGAPVPLEAPMIAPDAELLITAPDAGLLKTAPDAGMAEEPASATDILSTDQ
jgi:hypothetical protein